MKKKQEQPYSKKEILHAVHKIVKDELNKFSDNFKPNHTRIQAGDFSIEATEKLTDCKRILDDIIKQHKDFIEYHKIKNISKSLGSYFG
jgi:hypothetical protein